MELNFKGNKKKPLSKLRGLELEILLKKRDYPDTCRDN